jgi:Ca2+-binding EF-hand superfamily protein
LCRIFSLPAPLVVFFGFLVKKTPPIRLFPLRTSFARRRSTFFQEHDDDELKRVFATVAGEDELISIEEWVELGHRLRMNLSDAELKRVFDNIDTDRSGFLDEKEFLAGLKNLEFLRM